MKGSTLYKNMLNKQNEYREAFVELNNAVIKAFSSVCNEENSRIKVDEFNFVTVRVAEPIPKEVIESFTNEFDAKLLWENTEHIKDYRNKEETSATVYEYGFASNLLLAEVKETSLIK